MAGTRHHQDPAYNKVILHVVFWCDTGAPIKLQNGKKVSTLALQKYIKADRWTGLSPTANTGIPCHQGVRQLNTGFINQFLDAAGEERFLAKAGAFQRDLAQTEANQALYQGIMGALGYAKNKLPFLKLARSLPIQALKSMIKTQAEKYLTQLQALLLGTPGLLPSQRSKWNQPDTDDRWINELESIWASSRLSAAMSVNDWHLFKVRPNNLPQRRIAAMSHLILRYREVGILVEAVSKLGETESGSGHHRLERMLVVTTDGYWASHFDFGLPDRLRMPTLLGDRRAADIVVNVLLPFAFAWGKITSEPELPRKALELYYCYPRLITNTLERQMRDQLGLNSESVNSARRQQGLIQIYKTLCSQGKCEHCHLGAAW